MPRKRYKPEEVVAKLDRSTYWFRKGQYADAIQIGLSEVTFCRWRQGGCGSNAA